MSNGIELFPPGTPPEHRRRRLVFLAIWLGVAAMLTWPVYSWVAGPDPRVLGLPLSFAWVILALAIQFAALVWLFAHEPDTDGPTDPSAGEEG
ncbi:MAG: hypothetical protein AAGE94_00770 [Acidobacteriota bacterium]